MKKIKIIDITIRDLFQSVDPQHLNKKILDTILDNYNNTGFDILEIFGGSSFEKILENKFYLSPFEISSYIKNKIPSTQLQALIGAKNLVGLEVCSNNIIKIFIKQCISNGINTFRVYDALNDLENLKYTIDVIVNNDSNCQGTIIYDGLKDTNFYIETTKKLESFGCSSVCIKDVESTMLPKNAGKLFKALSMENNIPLYFSAYNLRGLQILNYYQACINGCNGVDISFIPSSYNDYNPVIFPFLLSLKDLNISHSLNYLKILKLYENIKNYVYPNIDQDLFHSKFIISSKNKNLLPKWLMPAISKQLSNIGELKRLDQVLEEIFKIKKEIGSPSLSTPIGQIIASQAILNTVISDYRWEITNDEIKKLICGYYGKLPVDIDKKLLDKLFDSVDSLEKNAKFKIKDIYTQCKNEISNLTKKEEDIISYCFFPEKTIKFLQQKNSKSKDYLETENPPTIGKEAVFLSEKENIKKSKLDNLDIRKIKEIANFVESSNINEINLELEGVKISINKLNSNFIKKDYKVINKPSSSSKEKSKTINNSERIIEIKSPIVGIFYRTPDPESQPFVKIGDKVKKGDILCIIEAMKLMNKINSDYNGKIKDILIKNEEPVEFEQIIMLLEKDNNDR